MPSKEILAPVVRSIAFNDVRRILPAQGPILDKAQVEKALISLESLEVGELMLPVCEEERKIDAYLAAFDELIPLLIRELPVELREDLYKTFGLRVNETTAKRISMQVQAEQLWDDLSVWIMKKAGVESIKRLEPHMLAIADKFGISKPSAFFDSNLIQPQEVEQLKAELEKLKRLNEELTRSVANSSDRTVRDQVTGLFSETFYKSFIKEAAAVRASDEQGGDSILAVIGIDENIARIEFKYGAREVEALLRGVADILSSNIPQASLAFRLFGATMAAWFPSHDFDETIALLEKIRIEIANSSSFIEPVTISVGVAKLSEVTAIQTDVDRFGTDLTDLGVKRLRIARRRGGNMVYFESGTESEIISLGRLLIVDDDDVNVDVLKTFFVGLGYSVFTASDGQEALSLMSKEIVDVVITELMLPKIDAYRMKESMLAKTASKDIPMI
ncbi:MAG: response regulator, partial [Rectinema sp.]|nr:response regulator [Rectinema sp.]